MRKLYFILACAATMLFTSCKKEVETISLNQIAITLGVDETYPLVATVKPAKAPQDVVWISSKPEVAMVTNGLVIAQTVGKTNIVATAGDKTAVCVVTVTANGGGGDEPEPPIGEPKAGDPKTINDIACVYIPSGTFMMGSPDSDVEAIHSERPQHQVTLTKGFYMSKYEITNDQFAQFLNAKSISSNGKYDGNTLVYPDHELGVQYNTSTSKWEAVSGYDNYPIVYVTWYGANEYAKWVGGVLPTEAQWEYACRAGSTTIWHFGDVKSQLGNYAWYNGNSDDKTHQVGTKQPNAWGLYDMYGNVYEWCADWYGEDYYSSGSTNDPTGPISGSYRMFRGGGYSSDAGYHCRSAFRGYNTPKYTTFDFGFRVVFSTIQF